MTEDLPMELLSALLGALVGGLISAAAAIWSTRKILTAEAERAASATEAERRALRAGHYREIGGDLLDALATVDASATKLVWAGAQLRSNNTGTQAQYRDEGLAAVYALRRARLVAPLGGATIAQRWVILTELAEEIAEQGRSFAGSDMGQVKAERAVKDVRRYLRYVQLTVLATMEGRDPPEDAPPPVLLRENDGAVWDWPRRQPDEQAAGLPSD